MGLFGIGRKSDGSGVGGIAWMKAIQEAKVQNTRMNDLKNIYQDNKNSGAHMVWQHLRDQSGNKMESHTSIKAKNKAHHELYVQRALKKAAQNENYNSRDSNFLSSSTRDQVLLMFRAAQKNKNKASQMLGGKHDSVSYLPGMLKGTEPNSEPFISDVEMDDELFYDEEPSVRETSQSGSSTLAYQKIHVEPLAQSSRNVSRSSLSWQPLSMTALQEYSPQISVSTKTTDVKEKLWNVI